MIGSLLTSLPGPPIRDVLVLGDPGGDVCRQLRAVGLQVTCCTDLQQRLSASHAGVVVTSLDDLLTGTMRWDAVVALDGFERIHQVRGPAARTRMMRGLRRLTDVLVVTPARRDRPAPDLNDLGPYDTADLFACFPLLTEIDEAPSGRSDALIILASTRLLGVAGEWVAAPDLTELSRTASGVSSSVRTFAWRDAIVKVEAASEHYFERCQALTEAAFLASIDDSTANDLALPRVRLVKRGRAVSLVLRDRVEGRALTPGEVGRNPELLAPVVTATATVAAAGLFHNDLRPWNMLWDGHAVRLIDWAEAGPCDADVRGLPQILALAGTLAALLTDEIPWSDGFVDATIALAPRDLPSSTWTALYGEPWLAVPTFASELLRGLTSAPQDAAAIVARVLSLAMAAPAVST